MIMMSLSMRTARLLALGLPLLALCACVSASERRTAAAKEQCGARGLTPSSQAFDDCVVEEAANRHASEDDQSRRMQQVQDMQMDNFMHNSSFNP